MSDSTPPPAPEEVIANRRWWLRRQPFPHLVVEDLFAPGFYQSLERAFLEQLANGYQADPLPGAPADAPPHVERFTRAMPGYDAMTLRLMPGLKGPLSFFTGRPFHDLLARAAGVVPTLDVNAGLHHHTPGSRTGWIHNDLNPGWFVRSPNPDGVNLGDPRSCDYFHGTSSAPPHQTVRAAAMLFYLANPPWQPGDGGETGLYRSVSDRADRPVAVVPPRNNSLLLFRCTPHSYHAFQSNRKSPRNTVILWLHTTPEHVSAEWGPNVVVPWPRS